jgi:nucleoside-diphosphate-sugar epimerase
VFEPLLAGMVASVVGTCDLPHSFAYVEDVVRAARAGADAAADGRACRLAVGVPAHGVGHRPGAMRLAGWFVPAARESAEMLYRFSDPFEVRNAAMARAFGVAPTPLEEAMRRTVDRWRAEAASV